MSTTPVLTRRAALASTLALLASGCFGEFGATRALYNWNVGVSDNKWLRWLVFLALAILPVYSLFVLADVVVLNTIEFFSGDNPVSHGHAELGSGHTLDSVRTADPNLIRHEERKGGKLVRVIYVRRIADHELVVLDEQLRVLSRVRLGDHGEATLYDASGRELSVLSAPTVGRLAVALEAGGSPSLALQAALGPAARAELASR